MNDLDRQLAILDHVHSKTCTRPIGACIRCSAAFQLKAGTPDRG